MDRIIIIGSPGSGKSTLAKNLGSALNLPVVHLDKLYWRSGWHEISHDEFDRLLDVELKKEHYIIDGNYSRTISRRLQSCDTIIYLDYPRHTCMQGVIVRIIKNHGKTRDDMGEGCPERFDFEFLRYVWNYNKSNREKNYKLLESCPDRSLKKIIILKSRKDCATFLKNIISENL